MKTKAQRELAVKVAKDVLSRVRRGKITPTRGVYCSAETDKGKIESNCTWDCNQKHETIEISNVQEGIDKNSDFRNLIKTGKVKKCQACAIGSVMISFAALKDNLTLGNALISGSKSIATLVSSCFTRNEVKDMERVFECYVYENGNYISDRRSLIAIMKNVIENKGIFKKHDFAYDGMEAE